MDTSQFLVMQPGELAQSARAGLKDNNEDLLKQVDLAFHHIFLVRAKKGTEESRAECIDALLNVTESCGREMAPNLTPPQRLLLRWKHLAELMEAFSYDRDRLADARRLVNSRNRFPGIIKELTAEVARGGHGLTVTALAERAGLTPPGLVPLLNELEQQDIVERHRSGRNVFVSLGLVGQLLAEEVSARQVSARTSKQRGLDSYVLPLFPGSEKYNNSAAVRPQ